MSTQKQPSDHSNQTNSTPNDTHTASGTPAPDAVCCTAHGCHEDDGLRQYADENGRKRVLCPEHGSDFLNKKRCSQNSNQSRVKSQGGVQ